MSRLQRHGEAEGGDGRVTSRESLEKMAKNDLFRWARRVKGEKFANTKGLTKEAIIERILAAEKSS